MCLISVILISSLSCLLIPAKNNHAISPTIDQYIIEGETTGTQETRLYRAITTSQSELKALLKDISVKYGLDYQKMEAVVQCESGWQIDPPHNNISWGIAQFTPATWEDFGYGDIMNPYSQLEVMGKMWSKGLMSRWDCYKILFN